MMRRIVLAGLLAAAVANTAHAIEFVDAILGSPVPDPPFTSADVVPLVRDGVTYKLDIPTITGLGMALNASNATLPGARTNLGLGTTSNVQFGSVNSIINRSLTNTHYDSPNTQRLTDRVLMGAAVLDSGESTQFPQYDWMAQLYLQSYNGGDGMSASGAYAQAYILVDINAAAGSPAKSATPSQALVLGNSSLNAISTGPTTYSTTRGLDAICVNNVTAAPTGGGPKVPCWALYIEAHRLSANAGYTYGIEIDVRNSVSAITSWTPYSTQASSTIGMELACGAGLSATGQFPCTVAMYIAANPMAFGAGIVFLDGAIGAHGTGGSKPAIMMPYDYSIEWWNSGTRSGSIYADSSNNLRFDTAGGGAAVMSSSPIIAGVGSVGKVKMYPGTGSVAGYFEFIKGDGSTRLGYIGANNTNMAFVAENSATFTFTGAAVFVEEVHTSATDAIGRSSATITGGSTENVPTLTTGPVTGNPTKWLAYVDNGTTRYIPSW